MAQKEKKTEYMIMPPGKLQLAFSEIWRYRELFYFFTWRDVKVKYKQTVLGFLWAILQPLALMSIFVFFFSKLLKISTDGLPPVIFYFSGLLLWNLFSSALSGSSNSMVENANIIKKVYFPRLIIPISSILASFFDFMMGFLIFIGIIFYYYFADESIQFSILVSLFYFVLGLALTLITAFGLGSLFASLNVKYRDFRYIIPFLIQFLMFISPVIYPISILKDIVWAKYLLALNPLTGALNLARAGFNTQTPDWSLIAISFSASIFLFIVGLFVFRKTESYFADLA